MNKLLTIFLMLIMHLVHAQSTLDEFGALIRSDSLTKEIYLCFTGHDFKEGFDDVLNDLKNQEIQASFFLTGYFIDHNIDLVKKMKNEGHYVGAHSDKHLLYNDWSNRDSLLYSPEHIQLDIANNIEKLQALEIYPRFFMPPYEWYNKKIVEIAKELKQTTVNFSPGTKSNADYTTPEMSNYSSSEVIFKSILDYEEAHGMNGFHLLIHPGTNPLRKDKFYSRLPELIEYLKTKNYTFSRFQD